MTPTKGVPEVLILVRSLAHEDPVSITGRLQHEAASLGLKPPFRIVHGLPRVRTLPRGSVIVTDALFRLGTAAPVLKYLFEASEAGVSVVIPKFLDLRGVSHVIQTPATIIAALHGMGKDLRSARIKESLFLRRERGLRLGRSKVSIEIREAILEEFKRVGTIRGTTRALNAKDIKVSRSSVFRIVRGKE